jgi:putative membrane protein
MKLLAAIFSWFVALLHSWFLILEMFLWQTPLAMNAFGISKPFAAETAFMAANQGLYNGFLVAGLAWGLISKKRDVVIFFLLCVIVAGIFGALTVKPTIFFIQSVPAILALVFTVFAKPKKT